MTMLSKHIKQYTLATILLACTTGGAFAQNANTESNSTPDTAATAISRDISVEKDYIPEIKNSKRPTIELRAKSPEITKEKSVKYSEYDNFISPKSVFNPLPQTDLRILKKKYPKNGFAQAAFGFPLRWNAEVFYPIVNNRTTTLDVYGVHDGIFTKKQLIDSEIGLNFTHKANRKFMLFGDVSYENKYYNYYGIKTMPVDSMSFYKINDKVYRGDSILTKNQTIHTANALIGFKNIKQNSDIHYEGLVNYKLTYFNSNALCENLIYAKAGVSKKFLDIHSLNIFLDVNSTIYNKPNKSPIESQAETNTVISILPSYSLIWNKIRLKAGAKIFVSFPNGTTISGSPDIHVSYVHEKLFDVAIGIDGNYKINSLSSIMNENLYFNPNMPIKENTHTPFRFYADINIKPKKGLFFNAYANYSIINNQYFFTNQYFEKVPNPILSAPQSSEFLLSNLFSADISNAHLLRVGISGKYNYKDKYISYASFDYTKGFINDKNVKPWYLPGYKASVGGKAEIIDNLFLNLNFNFESRRLYKLLSSTGTTEIGKTNYVYDLNFELYYTIMNNYTIFGRVNNILGNIPSIRYSQWYGYEDIGCNVLFGINFSF